MPYRCFADDDNAAVLLVTNLEEGDTQAVCPDHLADWGLAFLQAVTGQEWAVSATYQDPETGDETDEDEAADAAPLTPTPEQVPADPEPEAGVSTSEDEDQEEHDQRAEDEAVFQAGLREELAGRPRF